MRNVLNAILSISLIYSWPLQLSAQEKMTSDVYHQFMVNHTLSSVLKLLSSVKTGQDFYKAFGPYLKTKEDRDYAASISKKIKSFPKVTLLNRGYSFTYDKQTFEVTIENLFENKYVINGKFPFKYSPDNSLKTQVDSLNRAMEKKSATMNWLLPEAHAVDGTGVLLGIFITLVVVPAGIYIKDHVIWPRYVVWYCEGTDTNDYRYASTCSDYWKFKQQQRTALPDANPVPPGQETMLLTSKPPKCYSEVSPTFEQDFESRDKRQTIRRTVRYDAKKKPKEMVEEFLYPASDKKLIYVFNEQGQLHEILENDRVLYTRDPKKAELMTADKFKKMEAYDPVMDEIKVGLKMCDEAAKLKAAAEQPANLVTQTAAQGEVPAQPVLPSPGVK